MCRIRVSAVTGNRIGDTNEIDLLSVAAQVSRECQSFSVEILGANTPQPLFAPVIVQATGDTIDPRYPQDDPVNDRTIVASFDLSQSLIATAAMVCGMPVRVRITSMTPGCDCSVEEDFTVECKAPDPDDNPGGGGNPGGNNGGGVTRPGWLCPWLAGAFASFLWALLMVVAVIVAGTSWIPQPFIAGGIPVAAVLLALWIFICRPSVCMVLRVISLVFMAATLATFLLSVVFMNFTVAVLAAVYGGLSSFWLVLMRARGCTIPRFP